jgi:uncharacterized cupredoxin-like copper-binding protein
VVARATLRTLRSDVQDGPYPLEGAKPASETSFMYRSPTHRITSFLVTLSVAALVGACGGGTSTGPSTEPSTAASAGTSVEASAGTGGNVAVTLQEFSVTPDPASATAGSVTFDVTNASTSLQHEFVVVKTDLGADNLPTKEDGSFDEAGEGVEVIGEVEELDPGGTDSATFDLAAGSYVLICNIVVTDGGTTTSHYQSGMRIDFTVN